MIGRGAGRRYSDGRRSAERALRCASVALARCVASPRRGGVGAGCGAGAAAHRVHERHAHCDECTVTVGKSEDVRTDQSFIDIMVGDPEVADVNPLTDHALSILGKKIGTTRVTVYGEGKKPVGIFDVEVSYDISRLSRRDRAASPAAASRCRRSTAASCSQRHVARRRHARQGGDDRAPVRARRHQHGQVMQPQQVMLEVRFVEADRQASRDLGVQWNMFGSQRPGQYRQSGSASQLPITAPGGHSSNRACPSAALTSRLLPRLSRRWSAGVLSGASPFGFLVSRLIGGSNPLDVALNALEQKGLVAQPGASPISWRCRAIPRASSPAANFRSRFPARSARSRSTTRNTASASPSRRPCCKTA